MHVDLFVLAAQVVNFLLLTWALKAFVFDRVVKVMDEREAGRQAAQAAAEAEQIAARESAERFAARRRELEEKSASLLETARNQAETERAGLLFEARRELEELRERGRRDFERGQALLIDEYRRGITVRVLDLARRAFATLADARLEEAIVRAFIRRLESLPADRHAPLVRAAAASKAPALARSAFPLSEACLQDLGRALDRALGETRPILGEHDPRLVAGIELIVGGYVLAWNLDDFLESLAMEVDAASRPGPDHG